jgi:outer membrane protein
MKKAIFTISIILLTTIIVNAQKSSEGFLKGNIFTSGQFAFNSETTGDIKTTSIDFSPTVGYFVSNNVAIGVQLGVTNSVTKFKSTKTGEKNGYSAGILARYYMNPTNKFSVFGSAALSFGSTNNKTDSLKTTSFSLGFAPGISYFLSNHFAIETTIGSLGFSSIKPDVDGADATNSINFGLNLTAATFSLVYKF